MSKITRQEKRQKVRQRQWQRRHPHIVDQLIRERAEKLSQSRFWPVYRFFLNKLLGYDQAVKMADHIKSLPGRDSFEYVSSILQLDVKIDGLEHVPREGLFLLAVNHPTGLADGVAMFDALKGVRPDLIFFANSDAIRVADGMADIIIPVEWVEQKRTRARSRETLIAMTRAAKDERALILFPSGRLAFFDRDKVLQEHEWQPTVATLPRKYQCPIIPAHLSGRNSWLYYWFRGLNKELRDITLFHELLNKRGKAFHLTIGPAIDPADLPDAPEQAAKLLQNFVTKAMPENISWADYRDQQKEEN